MSADAAAAWRSVLRHEARDTYFRGFKYVVLPFIAAYVWWVALASRSSTSATAKGDDGGSSMGNGTAAPWLYVSPEGLRMLLHRPFGDQPLHLHYVAGIILVVAAFLQKHTVPIMAGANGAASSRENRTPSWLPRPHTIRWLHRRVLGPTVVFAMAAMSAGGFALRNDSAWTDFSFMMRFFVAPWLLFIPCVWATAQCDAAWWHAFFGNCVFKACIGVPLARVLGVLLQHWRTHNSHVLMSTVHCIESSNVPSNVATMDRSSFMDGWIAATVPSSDEMSYYWGISASVVVVSTWLLYDTRAAWKADAKSAFIRERQEK